MKVKKFAAVAAAGALAASLALFGCSSGGDAPAQTDEGQDASNAEASYTLVSEGKLTIATSPDYPPFENLEGDEAVGLDIDIAQAIADELGLELEVKSLQFDGILTAIAAVDRQTSASPASRSIPTAPSRWTSPKPTTLTTRPSPP